MNELNELVEAISKANAWSLKSLSTQLRELLTQFEPVSGNQDTEAELAARELHGVGMDLWGEDTSPKVDIAAKLKARLALVGKKKVS